MTGEFLRVLRKMDKTGITHRDVLILYVIINRPGICGQDITEILGYGYRSNVVKGIARLLKYGFIEDRRDVTGNARMQILHVRPAGTEFFNSLKFWEKSNEHD